MGRRILRHGTAGHGSPPYVLFWTVLCRGWRPRQPARGRAIKLPDYGESAARLVRCRGDLRSPAQDHVIPRPHHGESENISAWQGGRPKVAPTAGLCADEIRPGSALQSVRPAGSSRTPTPTADPPRRVRRRNGEEDQMMIAPRLRRGAIIPLAEKRVFLASRTCDQKLFSECSPFHRKTRFPMENQTGRLAPPRLVR